MLVRQHQDERDLTPDISAVGYIECTEDSVTTLQTFKLENVALRVIIEIKQRYLWEVPAIASAQTRHWLLVAMEAGITSGKKLLFLSCRSLLTTRETTKLLPSTVFCPTYDYMLFSICPKKCRFLMLRGYNTPYPSQYLPPGQMLAIQSPILQTAVQFRVCYGKNEIGRLRRRQCFQLICK